MMLLPIPDLDPRYLAGDDGHIYSLRYKPNATVPKRLGEWPTHDGYLRVVLVGDRPGKLHHQAIAPLIARAFHGRRPSPRHQVRHRNGNKSDNRPANLAWGTPRENAADRDRHGSTVRGLRQHRATCTDEQVREAVQLRLQEGLAYTAIADQFGVNPTCVRMWVNGRTRRDATRGLLGEVAS